MPEGIVYVEVLPVISIDGNGVTLIACSGEYAWRRRFTRSLWRKLLETSIRQLNEYELAERADRGRVVAFERAG